MCLKTKKYNEINEIMIYWNPTQSYFSRIFGINVTSWKIDWIYEIGKKVPTLSFINTLEDFDGKMSHHLSE